MELIERQPTFDRAHDEVPAGFLHLRSVGGIDEFQLAANGLRVLFLEARAAPVALLMLTYEVGSRHEPAGLRGASHMLEHLMFKGSARFNKPSGTSIVELLRPLGAQLNATTWLDRTNYFSLVPVSHLEVAAQIEADRMRNLHLAPADLEAERRVVLNEFDQVSADPYEQLQQAVWRVAFPRHAYGTPVLGVREDICNFTAEALRGYYDRHYQPDNATVTIIGDLSRGQALDLVQAQFGHLPAGAIHAASDAHNQQESQPPEFALHEAQPVVVEYPEHPGAVMLAYASADGCSADTDALELLGHILAGGRLSRLYRTAVSTGLASDIGTSTSRLRHPGLFQLHAALGDGARHAELELTMRSAVDDVRRHGVTPEELDLARRQLRGALLTSRDGPVAMAMQLNEAIAAGDWTIYATASERYAAVDVADVHRVAQHYLRDDALTVGHLCDVTPASSAGGP